MKSIDLKDQFDVLRARVETELPAPAVLTVTSAEDGDGKSLLAFGLAETLADARYRVLLVDVNHLHPELHHGPEILRLDPLQEDFPHPVVGRVAGRFDGMALTGSRLAGETPIDAVRATIASVRRHYDFVVVDGAPLRRSNLAVLFAAHSDAVLVALRTGRAANANDRATVESLARVNANVLGVVAIEKAAIRAFASRRDERSVREKKLTVNVGTIRSESDSRTGAGLTV